MQIWNDDPRLRVRWSVRLFKASTQCWYMPAAPCWFHRWTQRLFLGVIWDRIDE